MSTPTIQPGTEATVILPTRKNGKRMRLLRVNDDGSYTFCDPRNGNLRTVHPDRVKQWHHKKRMETR